MEIVDYLIDLAYITVTLIACVNCAADEFKHADYFRRDLITMRTNRDYGRKRMLSKYFWGAMFTLMSLAGVKMFTETLIQMFT